MTILKQNPEWVLYKGAQKDVRLFSELYLKTSPLMMKVNRNDQKNSLK